jgi:Immunity protein 17
VVTAGLVIAGCGAFSVCGAAFDWEWFMGHPKARFFVRMLGRNGTRVFYGALGATLVLMGVLIATGVLKTR